MGVVACLEHFDLVLEQLVELAFNRFSLYCLDRHLQPRLLVETLVHLSELPAPDLLLQYVIVDHLWHPTFLFNF